MQKTCKNTWCKQPFEITDSDLQFYEEISPVYAGKKELIPSPTLCPECRMQRRQTFRNEHCLYRRVCDLCQKMTISSFGPDVPFPVYCTDCWWSDRWDPLQYGQEFDLSRPFFAQFEELQHRVPQAAALQLNNENCEFNLLLAFSKNAYLCPGSYFVEDCYYLRKSQYCKDCANSNVLNCCELTADSTNCDGCFGAHHLVNCRQCSSSSYLRDCSGVKDCFMCSGIHNRQYCFKNEQRTKEAFEEILRRYQSVSPDDLLQEFAAFDVTVPKRSQIQLNCEGSTGAYLANCRNAIHCSDCFNIEDSKYLFECEGIKDSMDLTSHDKDIELCYEMSSGGEKSYLTRFCYCTISSPRSLYLSSCFYQSDSFGCDGLHTRGQYCILNKQCTKEEYELLVPKIIERMKHDGEYGEFFPIKNSPYAYNESVAQDFFPLTKQDAEKRGWRWREENDEMPKVAKVIPASKLPDSIDEVPDDIVNWAIKCDATGRPFRIIRQELDLYRKMKLPIPHFHPDERHRRIMALKNPRTIWERPCMKCQKPMETTYAPERPEIVYCEECYLKEIY
ncbi:MAG TPA: hypothetical protein DEB30_03385 [Candidatus Peribacter riflensis]|nr:MAG: hypothetical protein A2398_04920 [Candidatus Peribacteria bacterium RIFOXYB1_FULL_57_12]HBH19934.1 hypothetical protein [Candidatus Peribacter riflensis]HBU09812.1 hypothetical protein [Candidatus Peribacter riflensis]